MTHSAPPPLKSSREVPPELREALVALKHEHTDAARLERVAARLGSVLDAPPATGTSAGFRLPRLPHPLSAMRVALAAVSLGAAVFWLTRSIPREPQAFPSAPPNEERRVIGPGSDPSYVEPSTLGEDDAPSLHENASPSHDPADAGEARRPEERPAERPAQAQSAQERAGRPRRVVRAAQAQSPQERAASSQRVERAASPQPVQPVEAGDSVESQLRLESTPTLRAERPAAAPALPPSEVELLFRARRAIRMDPRAALRLLDEHAALHEGGMLAAEREVLAIEALWKLHHNEAAARRLERFKEAYPDSIYLPRLEKAPR